MRMTVGDDLDPDHVARLEEGPPGGRRVVGAGQFREAPIERRLDGLAAPDAVAAHRRVLDLDDPTRVQPRRAEFPRGVDLRPMMRRAADHPRLGLVGGRGGRRREQRRGERPRRRRPQKPPPLQGTARVTVVHRAGPRLCSRMTAVIAATTSIRVGLHSHQPYRSATPEVHQKPAESALTLEPPAVRCVTRPPGPVYNSKIQGSRPVGRGENGRTERYDRLERRPP